LARQNGPSGEVCTSHKWTTYSASIVVKQQTGVAPLYLYITAHGPSMTRLLNAALAIFVPPGIFKWEGLQT